MAGPRPPLSAGVVVLHYDSHSRPLLYRPQALSFFFSSSFSLFSDFLLGCFLAGLFLASGSV